MSIERAVLPGGKLLQRYDPEYVDQFRRQGVTTISAVAAVALESIGEATIGWHIDDQEEYQVAVCNTLTDPSKLRSVRNYLAYLNRNPRNESEGCMVRDDQGVTVLLSEEYTTKPLIKSSYGNFMLYEHLLKRDPNRAGGWMIRFPYRYFGPLNDYPNYFGLRFYPGVDPQYALTHNMPRSVELITSSDEYEDANCTKAFLARDWVEHYCIQPEIPRSWIVRVEGDKGSVWQNPDFTTTGVRLDDTFTDQRRSEKWPI